VNEPYCDEDESREHAEEEVEVLVETGVIAFFWGEFSVVIVAAAKDAWFIRRRHLCEKTEVDHCVVELQ